jgi:hypothetical protein
VRTLRLRRLDLPGLHGLPIRRDQQRQTEGLHQSTEAIPKKNRQRQKAFASGHRGTLKPTMPKDRDCVSRHRTYLFHPEFEFEVGQATRRAVNFY